MDIVLIFTLYLCESCDAVIFRIHRNKQIWIVTTRSRNIILWQVSASANFEIAMQTEMLGGKKRTSEFVSTFKR